MNNTEIENKKYNVFKSNLDTKTLNGVLVLLDEELNKFEKDFLGCDDEKSLFKLQGKHNALSIFKKNIEKIISDNSN